MKKISNRQLNILEFIREKGRLSSSQVFILLKNKGEDVSLVTIKRDLSSLLVSGYILSEGKGRAVAYSLSITGIIFNPIDAHTYCAIEPDKRMNVNKNYKHDLFSKMVNFDFFTKEENIILDIATKKYQKNTNDISPDIQSKEFERFIIELSWKSSKIEGNTYTLLDTEQLIKDGIQAPGHTEKEAIMILNHKNAFKFIVEQKNLFKNGINHILVEEVHKLLVKDLDVSTGVRKSLVGITGSRYKPLENKYQIQEALEELYKIVNETKSPYKKALLILLGISYVQPFGDGNKRTARLIANAILLALNYSPLSYRSIDEGLYREAMLVFYEVNSIIPMKKIFIEQYIFSSETYLIGY